MLDRRARFAFVKKNMVTIGINKCLKRYNEAVDKVNITYRNTEICHVLNTSFNQ
ncbi:hypothetical protein KIN20_032458 [Parelaphostrongylus tenuis]|uniref:Uncharacterized protein n=1 Tax=Parelaphostrongylus tenuis TaxID=148309 RepID=A0AAD5WHQ6_PARTN|nr:hypothetical protein KIN20_032458 [Parelaphostrongylus tenuis]